MRKLYLSPYFSLLRTCSLLLITCYLKYLLLTGHPMVPVVSVRVAGAPPAAAAGVIAGAVPGASAEEAGVEADVTLPWGRPQERLRKAAAAMLTVAILTMAMLTRATNNTHCGYTDTCHGCRSGCSCCWRSWLRWPRGSTYRSRCGTVTALHDLPVWLHPPLWLHHSLNTVWRCNYGYTFITRRLYI